MLFKHFRMVGIAMGLEQNMDNLPIRYLLLDCYILRESRMTALYFFDDINSDQYGVEEEGLVSNDENNVVIPENPFGLTDQQMHQLQEEVNPLAASQNHGIELYEATVEFIYNLYNTQ